MRRKLLWGFLALVLSAPAVWAGTLAAKGSCGIARCRVPIARTVRSGGDLDRSAREALQRGMSALADGDRSAFDAVFAALWPVLRRFAERALQDSASAEDAAQSALVSVLSRAAEFDPDRDALSWALGIGAYECRTLRKKRARRREDLGAAVPEPAPVSTTPEEAAIDADLQSAAADILGALRPADAGTLLAAAHGQREKSNQFRKRLERALSRFRKEWRARHGEE